MLKILVNIFVIIFTIYMIFRLYKEYKDIQKVNGKVIFWLILVIFAVPTVIYYLDRYNIASKFFWFQNSDSDRWFSFLANYLSSIISAVIGAVALVIMTLHQLNCQREKDAEDRRVANMPLLRYELNVEDLHVSAGLYFPDGEKIKKFRDIPLNCVVENIGLGHVKKICYKFVGTGFEDSYASINNLLIKKDSSYTFSSILRYKDISSQGINNKNVNLQKYQKAEDLTLIFYYEDMLNNAYEQVLELSIIIAHSLDANNNVIKYNTVMLHKVNNEKKIDKYPINI